MTVISQVNSYQHNADGVSTTFAFNTYFILDSDLTVYLIDADGTWTLQVLGVDYSVTGASAPAGGAVTFTIAPAAGRKVLIYIDPPLTQLAGYQETGRFPAKSHERGLDKLTHILQRLKSRLDAIDLDIEGVVEQVITNIGIASQPAAEAGVVNAGIMSPLRTKQAIDYQRPYASNGDADAGTDTTKVLTSATGKRVVEAQRPYASNGDAAAGTDTVKVLTSATGKRAIEYGSYRINASWQQYRFGGNAANSAPALQIGGGDTNQSGDGVTLGNDGLHAWARFQPSRDESPMELLVYNSNGQGVASASAGTSTIVRNYGSPFKTDWVGRKIYFGENWYNVVSVSGNNMVVSSGSGTVPFAATITNEIYHFVVLMGFGSCNVSGSTVTRIAGDPFVPFITPPFKLWVNGTLRTVTSCPDINTYVLSAAPGNMTNVVYRFEFDVNDQLTTFRLQKLLGGDEENLSFYARYDGYWIHTLMAGLGRYRKVFLGSGNEYDGTLKKQITLQPNGDLSLMGDYDYEMLRFINGGAVRNRLQTTGAALGQNVGWQARGADTNVGMYFDTKGSGSFDFFANQFAAQNFQIFGVPNANTWLAVAGGNLPGGAPPTISANGSAADIDIVLFPKNAGVVRMGYYNASADVPIIGYKFEKTLDGVLRKVPFIA